MSTQVILCHPVKLGIVVL